MLLEYFNFVPPFVLLLATVVTAGVTCVVLWRRCWALACVLVVFTVQSLIALTWLYRLTATTSFTPWDTLGHMYLLIATFFGSEAAAESFESRPRLAPSEWVCDPSLETLAMRVFFLVAIVGLGILALAAYRMWRERRRACSGNRWRIAVACVCVLVEVLLIVSFWRNSANFERMPGHDFNISSVSPDRQWEARLVPVKRGIDVNGVLLVRGKQSFWWKPAEIIGDVLTECRTVNLRWSEDSQGFVLTGTTRETQQAIVRCRLESGTWCVTCLDGM